MGKLLLTLEENKKVHFCIKLKKSSTDLKNTQEFSAESQWEFLKR
jgi:hypothetical protein